MNQNEYEAKIKQLAMSGNFGELQILLNEISSTILQLENEAITIEQRLEEVNHTRTELVVVKQKAEILLQQILQAVTAFESGEILKKNEQTVSVPAIEEKPEPVIAAPVAAVIPDVSLSDLVSNIETTISKTPSAPAVTPVVLSTPAVPASEPVVATKPISEPKEEFNLSLDNLNLTEEITDNSPSLDDDINDIFNVSNGEETKTLELESTLKSEDELELSLDDILNESIGSNKKDDLDDLNLDDLFN